MNQTTLGQRIAELRRQKNMTQEALAERLQVSATAVSKWENNVTCPDILLLPSLARMLGVSVDALLASSNEPGPQVRLARRAVYESDWVCLYLDTVRLPNGEVIDGYHQLHHPHESVSIVIFNGRGDILLTHNRRYTTGQLEWEVPCGRVETGESREDTARRESMEETGCTLRELRYLCWHNPSNGMSDLKMHVFAAWAQAEKDILDTNEVASKQWFSRDEVRDMLQRGEIRCGVSMLALLYALTYVKEA